MKVFFPTISIFIIALCHQINLHTNPETHIKLEMYRNAKALYSSNDQLYEQKYKSIVKGYNGIAEDIGTRNISKGKLNMWPSLSFSKLCHNGWIFYCQHCLILEKMIWTLTAITLSLLLLYKWLNQRKYTSTSYILEQQVSVYQFRSTSHLIL